MTNYFSQLMELCLFSVKTFEWKPLLTQRLNCAEISKYRWNSPFSLFSIQHGGDVTTMNAFAFGRAFSPQPIVPPRLLFEFILLVKESAYQSRAHLHISILKVQ